MVVEIDDQAKYINEIISGFMCKRCAMNAIFDKYMYLQNISRSSPKTLDSRMSLSEILEDKNIRTWHKQGMNAWQKWQKYYRSQKGDTSETIIFSFLYTKTAF